MLGHMQLQTLPDCCCHSNRCRRCGWLVVYTLYIPDLTALMSSVLMPEVCGRHFRQWSRKNGGLLSGNTGTSLWYPRTVSKHLTFNSSYLTCKRSYMWRKGNVANNNAGVCSACVVTHLCLSRAPRTDFTLQCKIASTFQFNRHTTYVIPTVSSLCCSVMEMTCWHSTVCSLCTCLWQSHEQPETQLMHIDGFISKTVSVTLTIAK